MKTFLAGIVLLGLIGGGLAFWYWQASGPNTPSFRTVEIQRGEVVAAVNSTGTVEPEEVVDVGAQVAGKIQNFGVDPRRSDRNIDYGSEVEEGTILAQLDKSLFESRVKLAEASKRRAEADLLQMQARFNQAEREWNRVQRLYPTRAVSDTDYELARSNYETAKAALGVGAGALAEAEATLSEAQINLGYTTIRSPVKGVVIDRRVNIGQTVVASLNAPSLFLLAKDLRRVQVWASVNEADIGQIRVGQTVRFTVDAYPETVFQGETAQIRLNASMTQNVVNYTVVVSADNKDGKLLPYLTANLQFEVSRRKDVLLVPNAALRWKPRPDLISPEFRTNGQPPKRGNGDGAKGALGNERTQRDRAILWVENEDGLLKPVPVRLGLTDGSRTEIREGEVEAGSKIVVGEARGQQSGTVNPFAPRLFNSTRGQEK